MANDLISNNSQSAGDGHLESPRGQSGEPKEDSKQSLTAIVEQTQAQRLFEVGGQISPMFLYSLMGVFNG